MAREDVEAKTLDETIAELEELRRKHGGQIEVASSRGPIHFRLVTFSEKQKREDGVSDFVAVTGDDGMML